jgi:hypothetical protein
MGTLLLGATVLALIVYLSARSARAGEQAPGPDADAAARDAASANLSADPAVLEAHAASAERAGYPRTAAAIRQRAARIRASSALAPATGKLIRSPIPEASAGAWTRFVDVVAGNTLTDHVSPRGDLGVFQMSLGRLADLGYVTNARRDASGKWMADWVAPLSQERFLADIQLQYQAFVKATQADRKSILAHHKDAVGSTVAGKAATLSGLLMAARQAGLRGFATWLASGGDATKFPRTVAAYSRANAIF